MLRYFLAATSAAVTAVVLLAGAAAAQPIEPPVSGDSRATAYPGNAVAANCLVLFPGSSAIAVGDITRSVDGTNTYVDITAIAAGVDVAGVVVKGGPAFNVYKVADLGALAWEDLHSPLVSSGKPAQISHWFACGFKDDETTTTTTTTTSTETSTSDTSVPSSSSTTTSSESSSSAPSVTSTTVTTTTTPAVVAASAEDDLASTGFGAGWLIFLGAALLLGGGALLLVLRLRHTRS
jgi:hypothetical protein